MLISEQCVRPALDEHLLCAGARFCVRLV